MKTTVAACLMLMISTQARAQGYAAEVAASKMTPAPGLEVDLVAAEPLIRQPVAIEFDDRGRLWCVQYLQYPNPAGLKRVDVDRFSRSRYDRMPEPPPRGPKGSDRITILEDADGDGRMDSAKDFVAGLSLTSSIAFGDGGVYVLQAPYLLFYPDRDRDDVPDADPTVLVKGFGMEDAHSIANSLTWGPDGWLYGLQGSTVTAKIGGVEFQQGVWRYHPPTKRFELFAEGGGNMWGLDFDADGELVASTNVGGNAMLHFVRGAYYWKQFGKHGPLHHPYAFGYFDHVPHRDLKGGHVSVGGLFYEADAFPSVWRGRYLTADLLEHRVRRHELSAKGSSFVARQEDDVLAANDTWFAPSDMTLGYDGCLYVADWHDKRTAHPDPDAEWDRTNGRIYRIRPKGLVPKSSIDFANTNSENLLRLMSDRNGRTSRAAERLLGERNDPSIAAPLERALRGCGGAIPCWRALCLLERLGRLDSERMIEALGHPDPTTRLWALRLYASRPSFDARIDEAVADRGGVEPNLRVISELAATAGWIETKSAVRLIRTLANRDVGVEDAYIPLRLWWSIERIVSRSPKAREAIVDALSMIEGRLARETLKPRLIRRLAAEPGSDAVVFVIALLEHANGVDRVRRLADLESAVGGGEIPMRLKAWIVQEFQKSKHDGPLLRLAVLSGDARAADRAEALLLDVGAEERERIAVVEPLGRVPAARKALFKATAAVSDSVAVAAFHRLAADGDPSVFTLGLEMYGSWSKPRRAAVRSAAAARPAWTLAFLQAVDAGRIDANEVPLEVARRFASNADPKVVELIRKHWGSLSPATPEAKLAEVRRLNNDLRAAAGNFANGRELFKRNCAGCHRLFGEGNAVGPELTHANRKDRDFLLQSLVDPSGVVRKEFQSVVVQTKDGRVFAGLPSVRTPTHLTMILSADERVTLPLVEIEEMRDATVSLMPEDLHRKFEPDDLRDLFRYLESDGREGRQE